MKTVLVFCVLVCSSFAQEISLSAGDSTLMQITGARALFDFPHSQTALSGGVIAGRKVFGVSESFAVHDTKVSLGDVALPFSLKTDFTPSYRFSAVGVKLTRGGFTAFAGETATTYQMPFFFGSRLASPTAALFYTKSMGRLTFDSATVLSSRQTEIETLTYKATEHLTGSVAGGLGSNSPFAAAKLAYTSAHYAGTVGYTERGAQFQRMQLPYTTYVENRGLNLSGRITFPAYYASADRTNTLSTLKSGTVASTLSSFNVGGTLGPLRGNGSIFMGEASGQHVYGETAGLGTSWGILSVNGNWYKARSTFLSATVTERLSRHISVNQYVQDHSVNFGGTYHTDRLTVSGGYAATFLPVLGTFQKVLQVTLVIQLPHAVTVTAGTLTTPDGKTRWTASGDEYTLGPLADIGSRPAPIGGKYHYTGRVTLRDGTPVKGAALLIGKYAVYTDSRGVFDLPAKKRKSLGLIVDTEAFMAPGHWKVVDAPIEIVPDQLTTITVVQP